MSAPSACTRLSTPSGRPACANSSYSAAADAAAYSAGFQTTVLPHSSAGHEVPGRHRDREVAGRDDHRDADRDAEREQLLVRHLRGDRLPVEPASLAEEEVAGVDDLLHLAERLGVRLADLPRDEPRRGAPCSPRPAGPRSRSPVRAPGRARRPRRAAPPARYGTRRRTRRGVASPTSATTSDRSAGLSERTVRAPAGNAWPPTTDVTVCIWVLLEKPRTSHGAASGLRSAHRCLRLGSVGCELWCSGTSTTP